MKDLFKIFEKDLLSEDFDLTEGIVYCLVAFCGTFAAMVLCGIVERLTA